MSKRTLFWVSLGTILAVTIVVYYPTLSHLLRGETYCYFLDTEGSETAWDLIKNFWNYESVRQIAPGDRLLFRPLLFTVLGIEKAYFGGYYLYWRIVALCTHLLATMALFRLLWKLKSGIIAGLMTILFSTSFLCLGTILYEQIACYALFTALMLTGLYYLLEGVEQNSKISMIISVVCMLIACFLHETGILFTMAFIGYVYFKRHSMSLNWKHYNLAFGGILVLWLSIYIPTKFINPVRFLETEFNTIVSWQAITAGLAGMWALGERWFQQALIPSMSIVRPMAYWWSYPVDVARQLVLNIPFVLNCAAIVSVIVIYLKTEVPKRLKGIRNSAMILSLSMILLMMLANSIFRTRSHGSNYLVDHNFNSYIWMALLMILLFSFVFMQKLSRKWLIVGCCALVVLIGINAPQTYSINSALSGSQAQTRAYLNTIDSFIDEHENEQDFSFCVVTEHDFQEELEFLYWRVPDDVDSNFPTFENLEELYDCFEASVPQIIYWRHWDNESPKYLLSYHLNPDELEILNE